MYMDGAVTDDDIKRKVSAVFEDWSRPIGVGLFLLLTYLSTNGVPISDMAWIVVIVLVGGREIVQAVLKK